MPKWTKEQEEAIYRSGENIIVSAGAGSGKTAVLTERVIQKLKKGIHIHELLILTFTKAAAAEMKERIRKSIKESPSLEEELTYIDSSYITTFDSFALSILKKYHYTLGLDKNIGITESSLLEIQKKSLLENVFEELYEEENKDFEDMIAAYCTKDDENLKKAIIQMIKKLELRHDLKDYLESYLDTYYQEETFDLFLDEYEERIDEKKNAISFLAQDPYLEETIGKSSIESYVTPILEEKNYVAMKNLLGQKFPSLPRGSADEAKKAKEDLMKSLKELDGFLSYGTREEMIENFLKTKKTAEILLEILKRYFEKIKAFKQENAFYEFTDIAFMAIDILNQNADIRKEITNSFQEILVDEYQDTNDLQETFISLIARNNVYMVGDIKQSIYRFRNANPSIFRKKYNAYQKQIGGSKIDLLKNFRSRREVLEDINQIFRQIMSDDIGGADYEATHQMVFGLMDYESAGKTGQSNKSEVWQYIPLHKSGYKEEEVEAFLVAKDIKKKIEEGCLVYDKDKKVARPAKYQDFVILMDRSTNFELYKKIFEYLNVPLTLYKDEFLEKSEDLSIIKNILDFVIAIHNHQEASSFEYDFVSIARSFLYAMKDEEILDIKMHKNYHDTLLYQDLEPLSKILDSTDIYHFLLQMIGATHFYEKAISAKEIEKREVRMKKTLELAHSLDSIGYSIYEFKDYLETLLKDGYSIRYKMNTEHPNSVKIMTIHTSKGLEYPICYFTGLFKKFNIQEIKDKFLYSDSYGLVLPYFEEGIAETFVKELLKKSYMAEEVSEKIRLFYVALTRAREKMIFILPYEELKDRKEKLIANSERTNYRKFSDILNSLGGDIQKQYQLLELKEEDFTKDYLFTQEVAKRSFSDSLELVVNEWEITNQKKEKSHFSKESTHIFTKEEKENMNFGSEVHELLEYLNFNNPDLDAINNSFLRKKIELFLSHPLLENRNQATIYKEYEFIYQVENKEYHGIIDCMLEYSDHIDLIDYKLKRVEDDAYSKQLNGYKSYLETITNKRVDLYLYSIIDNKIEPVS